MFTVWCNESYTVWNPLHCQQEMSLSFDMNHATIVKVCEWMHNKDLYITRLLVAVLVTPRENVVWLGAHKSPRELGSLYLKWGYKQETMALPPLDNC